MGKWKKKSTKKHAKKKVSKGKPKVTLDEDGRGNRREQHLHFWMKIIVESRIESSVSSEEKTKKTNQRKIGEPKFPHEWSKEKKKLKKF